MSEQSPIGEAASKRRFDEPYRQESVRRWQASGMSMMAFCRQEGLNVKTFGQWKRRRAGLNAQARPFVAVKLTPAAPGIGGPISLALPGDRRIVLPPGFDEQTLRRLLDVLEQRAC